MSTPAFAFRAATTSRGLIAAGEGSTEFLHPLLPTTLHASNGFLMILNGWNLNRRMADVTGYSGAAATAVEMLQMRAPRQPLLPAVGWMGAGRVFGTDYFWRYRWYDSRTGECSGFSPLPAWRTNLGTHQPPGGSTYLGQNAYFVLSVADAPAHADTLQLFRNTTSRADVVYLVEAVSIIGQTTVQIVDDNTDDELFFREPVTLGNTVAGTLPSGFSWDQGVMWPVCRAWPHPGGRTIYYGLRRFGRHWNTPQATVTEGSDLVTIKTSANLMRIVEPGRVGQRVRFFATHDLNNPIDDPTVYRFLKAESAFTFRIWPEIQVSADVAADATVDLSMAIEDDRDARWSFLSEVGKPWLIDPKKIVATGEDYDDGVMAWFSLWGRTFVQTRRRLIAVLDDFTLDPSLTMSFSGIADEGMVGFDAGCVTPFGWVYVNEKLGPRLFDGQRTMPLDSDATSASDFMAATQFDAFEPSMLEEVRCVWDAEAYAVVVSYVPTGGSTLRECMVYDVGTGVWRGPYRERVTASGELRTTTAENKVVVGDDFGGLLVREEQVLDVVPDYSFGTTLEGAIASVQNPRVFTVTGATFDVDADERLRGSPVIFANAAGTAVYHATIADVLGATQLELTGPPVDEDGVTATMVAGWTFGIGSIRWEGITAGIDGGEPIMPKIVKFLGVRYKRGTAATTWELGCAEDFNGTYAGERTSSTVATAPTDDVNASVYAEMALEREGAAFQLRVRGTSRTGDPQITGALLKLQADEGTLP